jgi:hypothetical protein
VISPPEKVLAAAKNFAREKFARHQYVMALHTHQRNPHVHLVVKAEREMERGRLHIDKAMLRERERGADTIRVKGEDELLALCLVLHDFPGLGRILETPVIAFLGRRVLRIAHQPRPVLGIVVSPFEPADLRLPSRRM